MSLSGKARVAAVIGWPVAHSRSPRLHGHWLERYGIDGDALLIFFSGSKGYHVGLPSSLWEAEPSADFHRVARQFAEQLAAVVGVAIDTSVYDRVRAFRAPNSRHPKTGLHKRRLEFGELLPPKPGWIEQQEYEERTSIGFNLERLTKEMGYLPSALASFAHARDDDD